MLLPAALGVVGAAHGYALLAVLILAVAAFAFATSSPHQRVAAALALVWLTTVYAQWHELGASVGSNATAEAAAESTAQVAVEQAAAAAEHATPAEAAVGANDTLESVAAAAAGGTPNPAAAPATAAAAEVLMRWPLPVGWLAVPLMSFVAELAASAPAALAAITSAARLVGQIVCAALCGAPIRSAVSLSVCTVLGALYVWFGRLARVYALGTTIIFTYYGLGKVTEPLSKRYAFMAKREAAIWSGTHSVVARIVCAAIMELKSVLYVDMQ
jgi:hypothetical protein